MNQKIVTLTEDEYKELESDSLLLNCLKECGVDNWAGYEDALEIHFLRKGQILLPG